MSGYDLPAATVGRIVKGALPEGVQVGKDVKESFASAGGLFALYLTQAANEQCQKTKRSTVSADDVLAAVQELEFDELLEPLQAFLEASRDAKKKKAPSRKESKKPEAKDGKDSKETKADGKQDKAKAGGVEGDKSAAAPAPAPAADSEASPNATKGNGVDNDARMDPKDPSAQDGDADTEMSPADAPKP